MNRQFGYSIVLDTAYGRMIVNRNDINQTERLILAGVSPEHETIALLAGAVSAYPHHPHVLDIGANVGTYALGLAPHLQPGGRVYAFEPQRIIFNMLAGSVALNAIHNIFCNNMAVGDEDGEIEIPQYDYSKRMNFGSVEFGGEQTEPLHQPRGHDPVARESVPLVRLDSLGFNRVGLMKIDVEGMEEKVISGAVETIARCRPMIFLETVKSNAAALRSLFASWDYQVLPMGRNDFYCPRELSLTLG